MRIQLKRGNSIATKNYTGLLGELVINTDNSIPTIHDGVTPGGLNLEGVVYSTSIPGIISPILDSKNVSVQPYLQSTVFEGFGTHAASYWEVATNIGFTNLVYSTGRDSFNLTSLNFVNLGISLDQLSSFYVRVRHESDIGILSDWSTVTRFTTAKQLDGLDDSLVIDTAATENDYFGYSTDISKNGQVMIVSSIGGGSDSSGVVDLYVKEFSSWVFKDRVEAIGGSAYSFGHSVSISSDGATVAVSSIVDNTVYIYSVTDWEFTLEKVILTPVQPTNGNFGYSINLSGDGTVIAISVCGPGASDPVVYIYRSSDGWTNYETVVNASMNANSNFGYSVSLDATGTTLVIGARKLDTAQGIGSGSAVIYEYVDVSWVETKFIIPSMPSPNAAFGGSVVVSKDGSTIAIGGEGYMESSVGGAILIYRKVNNSWIKETTILPEPYVSFTRFGHVDISDGGNILVIGAPGDNTIISGGGAIYVYIYTDGAWVLHSKNTPTTAYENSGYSRIVSLSGDGSTFVTGAYNQPFNGRNSVGVIHILS